MNLPFTGIFNTYSASCFQDSVHNDSYNRGTLQTKITRAVKKGKQQVNEAAGQFKEAIKEEGGKLQSRLSENLAYQPSAEIVTAVVSNAVAAPHLFRGIVDTATENVRQGDPLFYGLPKIMEAKYIPDYRERMVQEDVKAFTESVLKKVPTSFQFGRKAQASIPSYPTGTPSPTEHEKRADEPPAYAPALPLKPEGGWNISSYEKDIAQNSITEINRRDGNIDVFTPPPSLPKKYVQDPNLSAEQHERNVREFQPLSIEINYTADTHSYSPSPTVYSVYGGATPSTPTWQERPSSFEQYSIPQDAKLRLSLSIQGWQENIESQSNASTSPAPTPTHSSPALGTSRLSYSMPSPTVTASYLDDGASSYGYSSPRLDATGRAFGSASNWVSPALTASDLGASSQLNSPNFNASSWDFIGTSTMLSPALSASYIESPSSHASPALNAYSTGQTLGDHHVATLSQQNHPAEQLMFPKTAPMGENTFIYPNQSVASSPSFMPMMTSSQSAAPKGWVQVDDIPRLILSDPDLNLKR